MAPVLRTHSASVYEQINRNDFDRTGHPLLPGAEAGRQAPCTCFQDLGYPDRHLESGPLSFRSPGHHQNCLLYPLLQEIYFAALAFSRYLNHTQTP